MGGFHKNKGIVIELTALLDVIMIMLFWVMMNVQTNSDEAKAEADERVAAVEQQMMEIKAETDAEIARVWEMAENVDQKAAETQKALYGYEQGMVITLNIRYNNEGKLYISNYDQLLGSAAISTSESANQLIVSALDKAGLKQDDVILCALVYDSDVALYRDVKSVKAAVESVRAAYPSFYCTYIDTSK